MELILHKSKVFAIMMCSNTGEKHKTLTKQCLSNQKVNHWLPKNRNIHGLWNFLFPFHQDEGLETKWVEVVPSKSVWDEALWNTKNRQTEKGGMTELQSFEDGDNFNLMWTSVHVLWVEVVKHLWFHVCVRACEFPCSNKSAGCLLQDECARAWPSVIIWML